MRFSTWSSDVGPSDLLKQQPRGCFDHTPKFAAPADPAAAGRFVTMPDDVRTEMTELAGEHFDPAATFSGGQRFTHRLASRRMRNRSEEHTSELQSLMRLSYAVFCLKKKKHNNTTQNEQQQSTQTIRV